MHNKMIQLPNGGSILIPHSRIEISYNLECGTTTLQSTTPDFGWGAPVTISWCGEKTLKVTTF